LYNEFLSLEKMSYQPDKYSYATQFAILFTFSASFFLLGYLTWNITAFNPVVSFCTASYLGET
jgi:hypothetical protein